MTRVLAIETTGPGGGAALLHEGGLELATIPTDVRRARNLVPLVDGLLRGAGFGPRDLDLVACGVGPGSFTGIRIGIATAATLAYAAGVPVAAVGSLHGIAHNAPEEAGRVLVVLDARRGNAYSALFLRRGGRLELSGEYRHGPPPTDVGDDTCVLADESPVRPDAVARIALEQGERLAPHELRPMYLRLSDPELRASDR